MIESSMTKPKTGIMHQSDISLCHVTAFLTQVISALQAKGGNRLLWSFKQKGKVWDLIRV